MDILKFWANPTSEIFFITCLSICHQISHLNAKILEDQEDQKETKKDLEASTVRYQKEMEKMEARIKELEEEKGIHLEKLKKQSTDLVLQVLTNLGVQFQI